MHTPPAGLDPVPQKMGPAVTAWSRASKLAGLPFTETKVSVLVPGSGLAFVLWHRKVQGHPTGGKSQEVVATGIALIAGRVPSARP